MSNATPAPGVHHDDDGTARLVFDDQIVTLRRPRMGEYTELVDAVGDVDYEILTIRPQLRSLSEKIAAGTATESDRKKARDLSRQVQLAKAPLIPKVCKLLGDTKLNPDDLPPWAQAAGSVSTIMGELFSHWENVPFHGSGRNES
jgi:hypothetical protein